MPDIFLLSTGRQLAAGVAVTLVCSSPPRAEGMVPLADSGTQVSTAAGVPVVAIAAPSAAGLSHNRFTDYNVGPQGAVLNNATVAGRSVLAGELKANMQLQGRAASVILNEVVVPNPSVLRGQQEVFGAPADFVLSNPHGISCNGCGFINTPRATLLVGQAQQENGRLIRLEIAGHGGGALTVGAAGAVGSGVLDLIAPRIDAQGKLIAAGDINVLLGGGIIDYATQRFYDNPAAAGAGRAVDSTLVGGMQAGRIRIINTAKGAGINLSGDLQAATRTRVYTRGKLKLEAAHIQGEQVQLAGKDVSIQARRSTSTSEHADHSESWFIWKNGAEDTVQRDTLTRLERSRLQGSQIKIRSRREIALSATDMQAYDIRLHGRDVLLEGAEDQKMRSVDFAAWKNSWQRRQYTENESVAQVGSSLNAKQALEIVAQRDIYLKGAQLKAGQDVQLVAGQDIHMAGLVEHENRIDRGNRRLEGTGLASGSWNKIKGQQSIKPTSVDAGRVIVMTTTHDQKLSATRLVAGGDLSLLAGGSIEVSTQKVNQDESVQDKSTRWGGLAGSDRQNSAVSQLQNRPSELKASGTLSLLAGQSVHIIGSQLHGAHGARAVAAQGQVAVEHATDLTQSMFDDRQGGAFDILKNRRRDTLHQQVVLGTELASDASLELSSAAGLLVEGSRLSAQQALALKAGGDLRIVAAAGETLDQQTQRGLHFSASAAAVAGKPGTYRLAAGLMHSKLAREHSERVQQGSQIKGGSVTAAAGGKLELVASEVSAQNGNLALHGQALQFVSADNQQKTTERDGETGVGVFLDASLAKVRAGLESQGHRKTDERSSTVPVSGRVSASGDIVLDAGAGKLQSVGGVFNAAGELRVSAGEIDNHAAIGSTAERHQSTRWFVDAGAHADPSGVIKPIEKLVDKLKSGNFSEALSDALRIKDVVKQAIEQIRNGDWSGIKELVADAGLPKVGASIGLEVGHQASSASRQVAAGSRYVGGRLTIRSSGDLLDQASQYQATQGAVKMEAARQQWRAATTQSETRSRGLDVDLALQGDTSTGHDLALKAHIGGKGSVLGSKEQQVEGGAIRAQQGIEIHTVKDAEFQALALDGGQGKVSVHSGADLSFGAASRQHQQRQINLSGALEHDLAMVPGAEQAHQVGGAGALQWDGALQRGTATDAVVAQLSGQGGIELQAGQTLSLQGSQVKSGAGQAAGAAVALTAGKDLTLEAAGQSTRQTRWASRGALGVTARLKNVPGAHAEVKVEHDRADADTRRFVSIDTDKVMLNSGSDARLSGVDIQAQTVSGRIDGKLQLESPKQQERALHVLVDAGFASTDLDKLKAGEALTLRGKAAFQRREQDAAVQASRLRGQQQMDLTVAGAAVLDGAQMTSDGSMKPAAGAVAQQTVEGRHSAVKWGGDFSGTPLSVATQVASDVFSGKKPLGFEHEKHEEAEPLASIFGRI